MRFADAFDEALPAWVTECEATPEGEWLAVMRDGGSKPWAYESKPIYFFAMDQTAGDGTTGNVNQVWQLAMPRGCRRRRAPHAIPASQSRPQKQPA